MKLIYYDILKLKKKKQKIQKYFDCLSHSLF